MLDTKFEVATSEIIASHPHVSHLANHFDSEALDFDVLILVGSNCGPAMATKVFGEVAPFAHHTAPR